jgi:hypothetical protein
MHFKMPSTPAWFYGYYFFYASHHARGRVITP